MSKKLLTLGLIIFVAISSMQVRAQQLLKPDYDSKCEKFAGIVHPDFSLPAPDFRLLPEIDESSAKIAADMLDYARGFIGVRYRRGGKTPAGFDCSGFTGYVFRQFGYGIGASSRDQFKDGVIVDNNDIQPGDLLFFTGRSVKSGRVGHVAIAIDADGETGAISFIHASCSGGIRIDKTTDPYYARRYLGARRIIGND